MYASVSNLFTKQAIQQLYLTTSCCISPLHAVVLRPSGNVALGVYCDVMPLSILFISLKMHNEFHFYFGIKGLINSVLLGNIFRNSVSLLYCLCLVRQDRVHVSTFITGHGYFGYNESLLSNHGPVERFLPVGPYLLPVLTVIDHNTDHGNALLTQNNTKCF